MGVFGPGQLITPRSATIVKVDPLAGGVIRAFAIMNAEVDLIPDRFRLDVTTSQQHSIRVSATENPVQFGSNVTDHSMVDPRVLRLRGIVTDTPLGLLSRFAAANPFNRRSIEQAKELEQMTIARETVFVATSVKYYENMLLREVEIGKTSDTGDSVEITILLKEVRIVGPAIGAVQPDLEAILAGSGSTSVVDGGTQVAGVFG